jgi:hypothetical protein
MTNIVIRVKVRVGVLVLTATFNNISALSVEETGVTGENHCPAASQLQTLSHNVVLSTPYPRTGSYKYNYHMITTTTAP